MLLAAPVGGGIPVLVKVEDESAMVTIPGRNPLASVVVVVIVEVGNLEGFSAGVAGDIDHALEVAGPSQTLRPLSKSSKSSF